MKIICSPSFQRHRLERTLSLRDLSAVSGVASFTICRAENGRPVKPATAKKLCAALGAQFEDVFEVVDEKEAKHRG